LELAKTKLYSDVVDSKKYESYDGNIQGVADFMFYALCYLKMAREKYPEAYLRIKGSPRFINYMQRLWMSSEKTLSNAKVYSAAHGGVYYINQSNLDAMYSPTYISELDLLKISHAENISVR